MRLRDRRISEVFGVRRRRTKRRVKAIQRAAFEALWMYEGIRLTSPAIKSIEREAAHYGDWEYWEEEVTADESAS